MKSKKLKKVSQTISRTALIEHGPSDTRTPFFSRDPTKALGPNLFPTLLLLINFWVFLPVLKNDFVDADIGTIVDNLGFSGFSWSGLRWMFAAFHFGQYQPLTWLTFALDHFFWGPDPFGFHWTNLLLHGVNVLLFYRVSLQLLFYSETREPAPGPTWMRVAAWIAAMVFAIHPLRVESVAWASARGDLVGAGFFLLSLFGYVRANVPANVHGSLTRWNIISIGAFLISLLASPIGLVLPFILLVLDIYPLGRLGGRENPHGADARFLLWQKTPYVILAGAGFAIAFIARKYEPSHQTPDQDAMLTWALHQLAAPAFYLWKAILPIGLTPAYEMSAWSTAAYVSASALLCTGVAILRKRWPALAATWICFLFLALPIFRSEFPTQQVLADRFTYLAGCSWSLLIGVAISQSLHSPAAARWGTRSLMLAGAFIVILLFGIGTLSWNQVRVWRNSEILWKDAAAVNPTSRAYFSLATLYETQGKYEDAIASFKQAAEIDPQRWDAHERAAVLLQKRGMIPEAVEHFRKVVAFHPGAIEARENLAAGLVNQGEIGEAVQQFRKLLDLAPERNETRVKLGTILAVAGRLDEAADILTAAVKFDPNDARSVLKFAQVLAAQGKLSEAVSNFREAVRLRPEDAEAHESLGRALLELDKKDEAAKHLREALRILRFRPRAG
jgi:tetratricopeptide (TPR) repeat protein